ncbi:MAG: PstS family phosphate ABC transporter substrate-binding protein [Candidatus Zixiibacteriota bacterium]|nr:MAG: PstS family phosphate ABC transporter substrate-binding protein [candidate division Zixibacteria bacterium]
MRRIIISTAILPFVFLSVIMIGCSRSEKKSAAQDQLLIKGSDTMVHLGSTWAEAFMNMHKDIEVSVTGGGSGTGIAALMNGTTDICMASRKIKDKEMKMAAEKNITPREFVVARDGIAVVVNPANPLDEATVEQIGKIYTGQYTSWKQLGGPEKRIVILSRESSSGTYIFFQEHVLGKKDYTPNARLMPATSSIIQTVANDNWAIGYVGLGYALEAGDRVKVLAMDDGKGPVLPNKETVNMGEYSISRPLHLYTNGMPTGLTKDFIDFCLSDQGQGIVEQTGYIKVTD